MGQAEAIDVIQKAMYVNMNNALVCEKCCAALGNITLNGNYLFLLFYFFMKNYFWYFFFFKDANQVIAGQSDIINVIIKSMGIHINNPGVCEYGCVALGNIAADGNKSLLFKVSKYFAIFR